MLFAVLAVALTLFVVGGIVLGSIAETLPGEIDRALAKPIEPTEEP
jgi:hypothetical protein